MPTFKFNYNCLSAGSVARFCSRRRFLGVAVCAPMKVRLGPGKFREPDILLMLTATWDGVASSGMARIAHGRVK